MLVVVLASHVVSTSAAGRFPCTAAGGGPDQSICDNTRNSGPVTPNAPTGSQANTRLDRGSQCVEDPAYPGDFYCGGVGAQCSTRTQCDNGAPLSLSVALYHSQMSLTRVSQASVKVACARAHWARHARATRSAAAIPTGTSLVFGGGRCTVCLILVRSYSQGSGVASGVCGGVGAQCVVRAKPSVETLASCSHRLRRTQDSTITSSAQGPEGRYVYASKSCVSGYCNTKTRNCEPAPALGSACDPDAFAPCGAGLIVDAAGLCVLSVSAGGYICQLRPSQGARARRRRAAPTCPAHWHSCPIMTGSGAFECVNVQVRPRALTSLCARRPTGLTQGLAQEDLEQCGACAGTAESVDCTAIDHAESVACVSGACEVRSLLLGLFCPFTHRRRDSLVRRSGSASRVSRSTWRRTNVWRSRA